MSGEVSQKNIPKGFAGPATKVTKWVIQKTVDDILVWSHVWMPVRQVYP